MPPAVRSAFDVAFWFIDTALRHDQGLKAQKLQCLLFLAQAYYAELHGRKLMPAVFVADDAGPVEPNVHLVLAAGRPAVDALLFLPDDVERLLDGVWRRFGHHSAAHLGRLAIATAAYREAYARGPGSEIELAAMGRSVAGDASAPDPSQIVRPTVLRTQSGRPVVVKAWTPGMRAAG